MKNKKTIHFFAYCLSPKIKLPTRTFVDPKRAAASKSCDIPMLSSRSFTGRERAALTACLMSFKA